MFGETSQGWPRALCQQNISKDLNELKISWEEVDERTNVCGFGEIICWVYESRRPKPDRNKNWAGRVVACWVWEWTTNLFCMYCIADFLHIWSKKYGFLHPEKWVTLVSLIHTTCITASVNLVAINFKCTWEPWAVPLRSFHLFTTLMVGHWKWWWALQNLVVFAGSHCFQLQLLSFPMKPLTTACRT